MAHTLKERHRRDTCPYGRRCCNGGSKPEVLRREIRRREKQAWKKTWRLEQE